MSLSPEEYREHLATTAVRAGFSFDESQVVLPQSREFHFGRMRFHYLDWGNKNLPTIVFLHGGALTAHTWDLVCLALRLVTRAHALPVISGWPSKRASCSLSMVTTSPRLALLM